MIISPSTRIDYGGIVSRFSANEQKTNFLREIIEADLASGRSKRIVTRFPPEPSGHLHIGHARNITLNFQLALDYGGRCHLRMDDTNPAAEKQEYVDNIQRDILWLGFDWGEHLYLASEYFDTFYACAEHLVEQGLAYVCFLNGEQMRAQRGSVSEHGSPSPTRDASPEENLAQLRKMRAGE
jgi:glutaminyl-tRNA synthetase